MKEKNDLEKDQVYEVGFHLIPTIAEDALEVSVSNLKSGIIDAGAVVVSEDFPKMRQLAYPISKSVEGGGRKFYKAYFGSIKFSAQSEALAKIEKAVKANPEILRSILVKTVKENTVYYSKGVVETEKVETDGESKEAPKEISVEEIDKSIEELVIN